MTAETLSLRRWLLVITTINVIYHLAGGHLYGAGSLEIIDVRIVFARPVVLLLVFWLAVVSMMVAYHRKVFADMRAALRTHGATEFFHGLSVQFQLRWLRAFIGSARFRFLLLPYLSFAASVTGMVFSYVD